MLKKKILTLVSLFVFCTGANAALIVDFVESITTSGQTGSVNVNVSGVSYEDVSFNFDVFGDFGLQTTESIEFFIDGVSLGEFTASTPGITLNVGTDNRIDYQLISSISIADSLWNTASADGNVIFSYANSSGVGVFNFGDGLDHNVSFDVVGNVVNVVQANAPSTIILVLLSFFMVRARKTKK